MNFIKDPAEIEKRSFEIIAERLAGREFDPETNSVIKRVIHTTADFDFADNLVFSDGAVCAAKEALKKGARIVTDTQMARAGINKKTAAKLGCEVYCFIDSPEVIETARAEGTTRAWAAVDRARLTLENPMIFVVGNAPTALLRLHELIEKGALSPALIVAVPVGFVNVVESKEMILELEIPHIVAKGQKGGSNVAAAIINALLYKTTERDMK